MRIATLRVLSTGLAFDFNVVACKSRRGNDGNKDEPFPLPETRSREKLKEKSTHLRLEGIGSVKGSSNDYHHLPDYFATLYLRHSAPDASEIFYDGDYGILLLLAVELVRLALSLSVQI